jgi:hypothetical protein
MLSRIQEQEKKALASIDDITNERSNLSKTKDHKDLWKKKISKLKSEIDESDKEI